MLSTYTAYNNLKSKRIEQFDEVADKLYRNFDIDKCVLNNLAIQQGGSHKADILKKSIDLGGKINGGLGLMLQLTSITNPIGWGMMAANALMRGKLAVTAEKKMIALDEVARLGGLEKAGTVEAMAFAHNKLARKRNREAVGALPGGGTYGATAAFRHRNKANKGMARQKFSIMLWYNAINGDNVAQGACEALTSGKSTKILKGFNFPEIMDPKNHNKVFYEQKAARRALGYYATIMDAMKTT